MRLSNFLRSKKNRVTRRFFTTSETRFVLQPYVCKSNILFLDGDSVRGHTYCRLSLFHPTYKDPKFQYNTNVIPDEAYISLLGYTDLTYQPSDSEVAKLLAKAGFIASEETIKHWRIKLGVPVLSIADLVIILKDYWVSVKPEINQEKGVAFVYTGRSIPLPLLLPSIRALVPTSPTHITWSHKRPILPPSVQEREQTVMSFISDAKGNQSNIVVTIPKTENSPSQTIPLYIEPELVEKSQWPGLSEWLTRLF